MLANFVKETVSAGGTGNLTLSGAVTGFCTLNAAFGTDRRFHYVIEDGDDRESGIGYLSASTTLVRSKPLVTLVSGTLDNTAPSAIDASTASLVFVAASASATTVPAPKNMAMLSTYGMLPANQAVLNEANVTAAAAQRTMFWPILIPAAMELANIGFQVAVAAATCNADWGIYEIKEDGNPGALLVSTGAVDVTTTGLKETSVTNIYLPAGWYVAACASDSASTKPSYSGSVTCFGFLGSTSKSNARWRYDSAQTALADPAPVTSIVSETSQFPKIFLKAA